MELNAVPILFLDGQTTGFATAHGELLELGWSFSGRGPMASEAIAHELLHIATPETIPYRVWELTGLKREQLGAGRTADDVWTQILSEASQPPTPRCAVIHYAQFEKPFFEALHLKVTGQPIPWEVLCTYRMARKLFPNLPSWSIRAMSGFFGVAMPEVHRANDHVAATRRIWGGLVGELKRRMGIETWADLTRWLVQKSAPQKRYKKREFLLSPEKRLGLKPVPGIYEMLSRDGKVLYVGKATSLRDRVNSYFRARRSERSQLPELLSQVYDVQVTPTETVLEAALLESDRIKALLPPYNRLLKGSHQRLFFSSTDLTHFSHCADEGHPWGPFSSTMCLEELLMVSQILKGEFVPEDLFEFPCSPDTFHHLVDGLAAELGVPSDGRVESLLAMGKMLLRKKDSPTEMPDEEMGTATPLSDEEEVLQSMVRKLKRAALLLRQSHWISRLADSSLALPTEPGWRLIKIEKGNIVEAVTLASVTDLPLPTQSRGYREVQNAFDRAAYERMKICLSEISLRWNRGRPFKLRLSRTRVLPLRGTPRRFN